MNSNKNDDNDDDKETLLLLINMTQQTEKYDQMFEYLKRLILLYSPPILSIEHRNLFSIVCKQLFYTRDRLLSKLTRWKDRSHFTQSQTARYNSYYEKIQQEYDTYCTEAISLIDVLLSRTDRSSSQKDQESVEARVSYYKMKAECVHRLNQLSEERTLLETAYDIAKENLDILNTLRLGMALKLSVFYYEISNSPMWALMTARTAFDEALDVLHDATMIDEERRDVYLILSLLRDNITMWTPKDDEEIVVEDVDQVEDDL